MTRSARMLLAVLRGELSAHRWRGPAPGPDAYSLFHARSSAMGWLTEAREGAEGGLWGMNDAGSRSRPGVASWFQVELTGSAAAGRPLPTQPFLACATDVTAALGALDLIGVDLVLPVRGPGPSAVPALLDDAGWYADRPPETRTGVRVSLDGGQDPAVRSAADGIARWLVDWSQDVFRCAGHSSAEGPADHPAPADHLWNGPPRHRVVLTGSLVEWSPAAIGWLAAFLAEAAADNGVAGSVLFSVSPGGPGAG